MSKEVQKVERNEVVESKKMDMQQAIMAAVNNPDIDPERVERLLDVYMKIDAEKAKKSFFKSFSKFQEARPHVVRKKEGNNWKYATFEEIDSIISPILVENGFSVSYSEEDAADGKEMIMNVFLRHEGGHVELTKYKSLKIDSSGSKNDIQAYGSASSYAKRNALKLALGIVEVGEDDNGAKSDPALDSQLDTIKELIAETKADKEKLFKIFKTDSLESLPKSIAEKMINALKVKKQQLEKNNV